MARTEREKRTLKILGAVAAVAVVLALFTTFFVGRSNDNAANDRSVTAPQGDTPAPLPSVQPSPTPAAELVFRGVDPFKPLASANSGEPKSAPPAAPTPVETPAGPASAVVGGKLVELEDVFEQDGKKKAHVSVEGTTYVAAAGQNFFDDYVLVSFADPCVQFAWRDQPFRLCVQPASGG
ncbi:MAG: hypothetical protein ABR518_02295 [Actinomycetota bacterium]